MTISSSRELCSLSTFMGFLLGGVSWEVSAAHVSLHPSVCHFWREPQYREGRVGGKGPLWIFPRLVIVLQHRGVSLP